ncbi:MAG: FGGY family carbohydrate kinase, partial [Spirochaetaceae bacterium]|nr:FGGY family carbohydrate kinase [Spirochaetaceae bacterium]
MKKDSIIVVDTGTTSIRAFLFDARGCALAVSQVDNPPTYFEDGRVEQDPSTWSESLINILRDIAGRAQAEKRGVACIALASQRSSVIPVDEGGLPLHPAIMWQDTRTA